MKARRQFEDAVDLFDVGGAPYEAAGRAWNGALTALGRVGAATREARAALTILEKIGAARESDRAARAPASSGAAARGTGDEAAAAGLTT